MADVAPLEASSQGKLCRAETFTLLALGLLTLLSRLPFLSPGFGLDPDSWRMAAAARHLAETGAYTVSRFPGYPLPEMALSLLIDGGPGIMNLATAVMSVIAVVMTALIALRLGIKSWFWIGLALAFVPVVYIHSVDAMDYVWALALLMLAVYLALRGHLIAAGVALGLAIGCRITSGVLLLPLAILVITSRDKSYGFVKLAIAAGLTGIAAFLPALIVYRLDLLTFYSAAYPPLFKVLQTMTIGIFGRIGLLAVIVAVVVGLVRKHRRVGGQLTADPAGRFRIASIAAIALWGLLFLGLPHDSAYLIPAVPFGLFLLGRWLDKTIVAIMSVAIVLGSFGQVCNSGVICQAGILDNHARRVTNDQFVSDVIEQARSMKTPSTVAVGWWLPQVEAAAARPTEGSVKFIYLLDSTGLAEVLAEGRQLYYLPEIARFNRDREKLDLDRAGGRPLPVSR